MHTPKIKQPLNRFTHQTAFNYYHREWKTNNKVKKITTFWAEGVEVYLYCEETFALTFMEGLLQCIDQKILSTASMNNRKYDDTFTWNMFKPSANCEIRQSVVLYRKSKSMRYSFSNHRVYNKSLLGKFLFQNFSSITILQYLIKFLLLMIIRKDLIFLLYFWTIKIGSDFVQQEVLLNEWFFTVI